MKKITRLAATSLAALFALAWSATSAQAQLYVEGTYMPSSFSFSMPQMPAGVAPMPNQIKAKVFAGTLGYGLHPNLAIETVQGLAVKKDQEIEGIEIKSAYNLYLRPRYQLGNGIEVYARLGRVRYQFDTQQAGMQTVYANSWGLGVSYTLSDKLYLTGGYTSLLKSEVMGIPVKGSSSPNIGIGYRF